MTQETSAPTRTERKKEETKVKIIRAAMGLIRDQGYDATTMEQIAEEADIAKGTLYNYFPVKEAILSEYIQRAFQEKNEARKAQLLALPDTRSRLERMLNQLIEGVGTQTVIFEKYLIYQVQGILSLRKREDERSGMDQLANEIIRLGQESGEIRTDIPVWVMEEQFGFIFVEIVKHLMVEKEKFQAQETIARFVDFFLNGVRNK